MIATNVSRFEANMRSGWAAIKYLSRQGDEEGLETICSI